MAAVRSVGFWVTTLAAVGGAAGFFGPMILQPEANQGPLVGILITGPGGAVLGFVLGLIFRFLPFTDAVRTQALVLAATALGLGTLWFALPEPAVKLRVIDARISDCKPPGELIPARIAHWEERIAAVTWASPRTDWRDTQRLLREHPGVVVELEVVRSNAILEHRRPWERGRLSAEGWKPINDTKRYFGGGTCASYPPGKQVLLAPYSFVQKGERQWPPADLPSFLGVQVLDAVPPDYRRLVTRS